MLMALGRRIMPNKFHQVQYLISGGLCGLTVILYVFSPRDKSELLGFVVASLIGFITGKFTNGFGSRGSGKAE